MEKETTIHTEAVVFPNEAGERLFGILMRPQEAADRPVSAVVISVDGIKPRVGSARFNHLVARHLCSLGYAVLYFDPAGNGDSEGDFPDKFLMEHYLDIQRGKFVADTHAAIGFLRRELTVEKMILLGLCGGALTSVYACAEAEDIDGLVLFGTPILLENTALKNTGAQEADLITSREQALPRFKKILRKALMPKVWWQTLTSYSTLVEKIRLLTKLLKILPNAFLSRIWSRPVAWHKQEGPVSAHPQFNLRLQRDLGSCLEKGTPTLLVFGENDHVTWNFKSEFQSRALVPGGPFEDVYEFHIIPQANHIFSSPDSRVRLYGLVDAWLSRIERSGGTPGPRTEGAD